MKKNSESLIRHPSVSGTFYPDNREELIELIESFKIEFEKEFIIKAEKRNIHGGVVPHAGYIFSGMHAASFFGLLQKTGKKYDTVVVVHPNHSGYGPAISVDGHTHWSSPLGLIEVDIDLSNKMGFPVSQYAQKYEHSAEVMIPLIIYYLGGRTRLVSVNMLDQSVKAAKTVAQRLIAATEKTDGNVLVLASSDFTHFETPEEAERRDSLVLELIYRKNTEQLYELVTSKGFSVCGYGPIMALMEYCSQKFRGYEVELLGKGNSGDIIPSDSVVSYITLLFSG